MTCSSKPLLAALAKVKPASGRTTLDLFRAVTLSTAAGKLFVKTVDAEMSASSHIAADGELQCCVTHDALVQAVTNLSSPEVELVVDDGKLVVRGGKARYRLGIIKSEYGEPEPKPVKVEFVASGDFWRDVCDVVLPAAGSIDEHAAICLQHGGGKLLRGVGYDGTHMVMADKGGKGDGEILITTTSARRLAALSGDIKVSVLEDDSVFWSTPDGIAHVRQPVSSMASAAAAGAPGMMAEKTDKELVLECGDLRRHLHWFMAQQPMEAPVLMTPRPDGIVVESGCGGFNAKLDGKSGVEFKEKLRAKHLSQFIESGPFLTLNWRRLSTVNEFGCTRNGVAFTMLTAIYTQ